MIMCSRCNFCVLMAFFRKISWGSVFFENVFDTLAVILSFSLRKWLFHNWTNVEKKSLCERGWTFVVFLCFEIQFSENPTIFFIKPRSTDFVGFCNLCKKYHLVSETEWKVREKSSLFIKFSHIFAVFFRTLFASTEQCSTTFFDSLRMTLLDQSISSECFSQKIPAFTRLTFPDSSDELSKLTTEWLIGKSQILDTPQYPLQLLSTCTLCHCLSGFCKWL